MKGIRLNNILFLFFPFAATACLLTVIHPPFNLSLLAWVSMVPFILACSPKTGTRCLAVVAYVVSACYWLGNLYWIGLVTWPGWATFCLYTALLWPVLALCLRYCRIKKFPLFLAVPVLVVGVENLQGLFLGGFYWRHLSHSQYANISLIQIADIFGAAGVSFLIAMVNGLAAELIISVRAKSIFKIKNYLKIAFVCGAVAATVIYGQWRIKQSDEFIETGPLVASAQSNVPQSVKESHQAEEEIFNDLLQSSSAAFEAGAELVVWPETMVQVTLNPRILSLLADSHTYNVFDKTLREHSKNNGFVLVGAYGGVPEIREDLTIHLAKRYNTAFLYTPDGRQGKQTYNKIHLVPFGEVIPLKDSVPWLHSVLMKFTPYDYDYSLNYGTDFTVFEMTAQKEQKQKTYTFSVMICYEDTVPAIARKFAIDEDGKKRLDWLVNISNDGWFVKFKNQKVMPSTELAQHTAICVFRAVENRLAVLRSVNTGISCLVDTLGRVKNGFFAGNLPKNATERQGMAGWFADNVPIDKRVTFFCRYGQWLEVCCVISLCMLITMPFLARAVRKKYSSVLLNKK